MSPTPTKGSGMSPGACTGLICLPPISDDMQLIWTQAELTSELDDHPQLLHTFSYFPYPSMPEIVHLSLRFGLQIGKVKTWFMVQRIRCGISWSPEEIEETRSRLLYNQDQLHFKPLVALSKKNSLFHTPEKLDTPNIKSKQDNGPPPLLSSIDDAAPEAKKLKTEYLAPETDQERTNIFFPKLQIQSPAGFRSHSDTYGHHSPDSNLCAEQQLGAKSATRNPTQSQMFGADETQVTPEIARLQSEEEFCSRMETPSWNTDGFRSVQGQEQSGAFREDSYTPVTRRQRKTKEQLSILKSFFLKCQWACREDYKKLEEMTGLPRPEIIQWFGDTRYALKHGQLKWFRDNAQGLPRWLDEPQHQVNQNGKQIDPKLEGDSGTGITASVVAVSETDLKTTVQPITASTAQTPALKTIVASNLSGPPVAKAPGKPDEKLLASLETTKSRSTEELSQQMLDINCPSKNNSVTGQESPTGFPAAPKSPCGPSSPIPAMSSKIGYAILERHWSVQRHIKEEDLQLLITKSGLSRKEVKDWFCHKSNEPAEVEVCLDEEEEDDAKGEMEEGEDDVVIQD